MHTAALALCTIACTLSIGFSFKSNCFLFLLYEAMKTKLTWRFWRVSGIFLGFPKGDGETLKSKGS